MNLGPVLLDNSQEVVELPVSQSRHKLHSSASLEILELEPEQKEVWEAAAIGINGIANFTIYIEGKVSADSIASPLFPDPNNGAAFVPESETSLGSSLSVLKWRIGKGDGIKSEVDSAGTFQ